jgi:glycosyltransferase involved in cell wall biosynthesis
VYYVRRFQEALNYRQADRFIVLSRAFGEVLSQQFKVPWNRIRVIPGGVSMKRFAELPNRSEARERLGWPADRPIVTTVRRLVPSKGIDRLIDAIAEVRRHVPDIFCAVVGGGPMARALQCRIDDKGLGANVRLIGYVPDDALKFVYCAADLFVVPTIAYEGFGLAVIESLACGTPTIVTPIGGLSEAVSELSTGLVLADSSVRAIATGITQAFEGSIDLPTRDGCIRYARRFDWSAIAPRVGEVYREVI